MEYVCTGATLKCTMGTSCPKLKATPKNVSLTGKDQANIADYVSMKNVPSFGRCRSLGYPPTASATAANHGKLTPMPCVPGTCPKWKVIDKDSLICGEPALLKPATLKCKYGGTISIIDPGQTLEIKVRGVTKQSNNEKKEKAEQEIPEELLQEFNELDTEGLNKESVLDGVQLALDAAGMVPVLGAIPDLINASISVLRGDWIGAGLSIVAAVPGVGDVVGGAKIAYKGAKMTKLIKNNVSKNIDVSIKGLVKQGLSIDEAKAFRRGIRNERRNVAKNFYKDNTDWDNARIESHLRGIDYTKPVIVDNIPPPGQNNITLYQYKKLSDNGEFLDGDYYTINPNAKPNELGVADAYSINDKFANRKLDDNNFQLALPFPKEKFSAQVSESTPCLRSTAKSIYDDWSVEGSVIYAEGGAEQLFIPNIFLQNVIKL